MSLIDLRPGLPKEALQYGERAKLRLTVKPGCGGPLQSGGRSDSTFEGLIGYDLWWKGLQKQTDIKAAFLTSCGGDWQAETKQSQSKRMF